MNQFIKQVDKRRFGLEFWMHKYLLLHSFSLFIRDRSHITQLPERGGGLQMITVDNGGGRGVEPMIT